MSKDVRIEVIYYKTPADISLEFGLHGDYPLRMLSENCNNRNTFFQFLKRAVLRSEIIIVIGGYNDEDKIPQFISKAIGYKSYTPNYKDQNIDIDVDYQIPESAEILATKFSNRFGGFLVECGPQTIISLTDEKFTRNSIIKEFVVNYITEHHKVFSTVPSAIVIKDKAEDVSPSITEITDTSNCNTENSEIEIQSVNSEQEQVEISETLVSNEESITVSDTQNDINDSDQIQLQYETAEQIKSEESELSSEVSDGNITSAEVIEETESSENVNSGENTQNELSGMDFSKEYDLLPDFEKDNSHAKPHRRRRKIRILCVILSVLVVLGSVAVAFLIKDKPVAASTVDYYSELAQTYHSFKGEASNGFENLLKTNPQFFTWIKFNDGKIDHPVLTVNNNSEINDYMTKLPNGSTDKRGTLVSLNKGIIVNNAYNTVIYGNASKGGLLETFSLFSQNFNGQYITTSDTQYSANWQIVGTFSSTEAGNFDYTQSSFADSDEYLSFLNKISDLSPSFNNNFSGIEKIITFVGIKGEEKIITVAVLRSMLILSLPDYQPDKSNDNSITSSDINSSEPEITEPEIENDNNDYTDYLGETPDIVLPELPPPPPINSEVSSSNTQSQTNSSIVSSTVNSQINSFQNNSTDPSVSSSVLPNSSDSVTSSTPQSSMSSVTSSNVSQPVQPKPDIDPRYTWDVYLACKSNSTGEVIIGDAVTIIAMIIEIEMSPTIDPPEALIAQAVVKYNWMLNNGGVCTVDKGGTIIPPTKAPTNAIDINPTPQALKYAAEAKGMLLMYGNTLAKTYCHSYSAGYTAAYHNIWSGGNYPYLQGVECPVDSTYKYFETKTTYSSETIKTLIKNKLNVDVSNMPKTDWLKPIKYDNNNTYCVTISIGGIEKHGTYLRNNLLKGDGVATIRSSAYTIEYNETTDEFTVIVRGHGHGVGLSQNGAKQYAKQGWNCEQILKHFFPGTTLIKN